MKPLFLTVYTKYQTVITIWNSSFFLQKNINTTTKIKLCCKKFYVKSSLNPNIVYLFNLNNLPDIKNVSLNLYNTSLQSFYLVDKYYNLPINNAILILNNQKTQSTD